MSRRISARLREEAAVACAQNATQLSGCGHAEDCSCERDIYPWECSEAAQDLAHDAVSLVSLVSGLDLAPAEQWAEAEALLRTGWSP